MAKPGATGIKRRIQRAIRVQSANLIHDCSIVACEKPGNNDHGIRLNHDALDIVKCPSEACANVKGCVQRSVGI